MTSHGNKTGMLHLWGGMSTLIVGPAKREELGIKPGFVGQFIGIHRAVDSDHLPPELRGTCAMIGTVDEATAYFAVLSLQQLDALEAQLPELRNAILAEERAQGSVQ